MLPVHSLILLGQLIFVLEETLILMVVLGLFFANWRLVDQAPCCDIPFAERGVSGRLGDSAMHRNLTFTHLLHRRNCARAAAADPTGLRSSIFHQLRDLLPASLHGFAIKQHHHEKVPVFLIGG